MSTSTVARPVVAAQSRRTIRTRVVAVIVTVAAFLVGIVGTASAAPAPPDPGTIATSLVNSAGGAYLDGLIEVLPLLVGFLVALWAIGFVWKKVSPRGKKL